MATRPVSSQHSNTVATTKVATWRVQCGSASASQSPAGLASAILMSSIVSGMPVRPIFRLLIQLSSHCSANTPASVTMPKGAGSRRQPAATKQSSTHGADWTGHAADAAAAPATSRPANAQRSQGQRSWTEPRDSQMPVTRTPAAATWPMSCVCRGSISHPPEGVFDAGTRLQGSQGPAREGYRVTARHAAPRTEQARLRANF
jgi:hypothetical protein